MDKMPCISGKTGPCPIEDVISHDRVVVFGASGGGIDVRNLLRRYDVEVTAFLDNNPEKHGTEVDGLPVWPLESFMKQPPLPVVVGSAWAHEIVPQCLRAGVRRVYDMNWFCVKFLENPDRWLLPISLLADDASRAVYSHVLYALFNRWANTRVATSTYARFGHPCVAVEDGDTVICGGLYDGTPALRLLSQAGCRVHGFEPLEEHRKVAKKRLERALRSGHVVLRTEALHRRSGLVPFLNCGFGSHVVDASDERVPAVTVDEYVRSAGLKSVSLIQLEIEGAELDALTGAGETLKHFRPKLQVSMAKRFADYGRVISFLHGLDLGYSMYVGHHTELWSDTVLYARSAA